MRAKSRITTKRNSKKIVVIIARRTCRQRHERRSKIARRRFEKCSRITRPDDIWNAQIVSFRARPTLQSNVFRIAVERPPICNEADIRGVVVSPAERSMTGGGAPQIDALAAPIGENSVARFLTRNDLVAFTRERPKNNLGMACGGVHFYDEAEAK